MKKIFFVIILLIIIPNISSSQNPDLKINNSNYQIEVKLDTKRKTIEGSEIITWINNTRDIVDEIQLHLYHNAYRNDKSSYCAEGKIKINFKEIGYTNINFIKILNSEFPTPETCYFQPDDNNPYDQTVLKVKLPKPVKPNQIIKLNIGFITKLPAGNVARSGFARGRDYFFVSEWFPKLGVYEEGKGWSCHQFHYWTDFYSDFGIYEVKITVPRKYYISATGIKENEIDNGNNTITYTFRQEKIHDFVWTASTDFVVINEPFIHPFLPTTNITLLLQPEHQDQSTRYLSAAKAGLKKMGEWFGPYPYKNLIILDPPLTASQENLAYPMIIKISTNFYLKDNDYTLENEIINKICRQYWYGVVSNNSVREAWLDKGISTYITGKIVQDNYGNDFRYFYIGDGVPLSGFTLVTYDNFPVVAYMGEVINMHPAISKINYLLSPSSDPINKDGWKYKDITSYRASAYYKTDLMLMTLENYIGSNKFAVILKSFYDFYKFKHPGTLDFTRHIEKNSGIDFTRFFSDVLFSTELLDYAITDIRNIEIDGKSRVDLIISRAGTIRFPLEIQINLENGSKIMDSWNGEEKWILKTYFTNSPASSAQIDPNNKIPLDINPSNNSKLVNIKWSPVLKWAGQWLFWMQAFLQILSSIC